MADVAVFARAIPWVGLTNKKGWRWRGVAYDIEHGYRECGEHFHSTQNEAKNCALALPAPAQEEGKP